MDPDPDQYHDAIERQPGPAVIKAWAPWCRSCRAVGPIADGFAEQTGVAVVAAQLDGLVWR